MLDRLARELAPPVVFKAMKRLRRVLRGTNPANGAERPAKWYDRMYSRSRQYERHYTRFYLYPSWLLIVDRIKRADVKRILDLGCGPGQFAVLLHDRGLPEYCGVDFSETCISMARRKCPSATFMQEDVFETGLLQSYPYDAVVCTELLEHVSNDVQLLHRVRPGSRFFGSVPSSPHESHVRWFQNCEQVAERYAHEFDSFSVDHVTLDEHGAKVFLFEGVKQ